MSEEIRGLAHSQAPEVKGERFHRRQRLRKRSEFRHTERFGTRVSGSRLVVYAHPNDTTDSKLGITASRKVGNAIVRNRWKRRIREIFRRNKFEIPQGFDFVVIVRGRRHSKDPGFDMIRNEVMTLLRSAGNRAGSEKEIR